MRPCATMVLLALMLCGASTARASMTLDGVSVDKASLLGPGEWTVPDNGGTVTWTAPDWTGTYTFSVPGAIPDGGIPFTMSVKAESRKNAFNQHTRFAPAMTAIGGLITPTGRADVSADANSETRPTDERSVTVQLSPSGGTTITVDIQDGPTYTLRYKVDPPPAQPPATGGGVYDVLRPPSVFCAASAAAVAHGAQASQPCVGTRARTPAEKQAERRAGYRFAVNAIALCFFTEETDSSFSERRFDLICAGMVVEALNAYLASIAADPPDPRIDRIVVAGTPREPPAVSDLATATRAASAISQALAQTTNRFDAAVAAGQTAVAALQRAVMKTYYGQLAGALARQSTAARRLATALRGRRGTRLAARRVRAIERRLFSLSGAPQQAIATLRAEGFSTKQIAGALRGVAGLVPDAAIDVRGALGRAPRTQAFEVAWGSLNPSDVALITEALRKQGLLATGAETDIKTRLAALAPICDAGSRTAAVRALIGYVNGMPRNNGHAQLTTAVTGLLASRC